MKKWIVVTILMIVATMAVADGKPQTTCPIMGGKINPKQYANVEGYRIYVCCKPCIAKVKADPKKIIETLKADGVEIEKSPAPTK